MNTSSTHCHQAVQCLLYSENVAGLWLKYGVKSPNISTSWPRRILPHCATISGRWLLTVPIGRAYNPATERGAALAQRPRQSFAPLMLLIMMSESTADRNRLLFAVGYRVSKLP